MDIEPIPFWNLVSQSQILTAKAIETLSARYGEPVGENDGETAAEISNIVKTLVNDKVITQFHADVLSAGRHGPFRFGEYIILDHWKNGPLGGCYSGKHVQAGHRVLIEFFAADDEEGLERWRQTKSIVKKIKAIECNNLIAVHETVAVPEHRMIISQRVNGMNLSTKLPRKGRLPWKNACEIAAQLARALDELHRVDICHGHVSPRNIWLANKGPAMLRFPFNTDSEFNVMDSEQEEVDLREEYLAPELGKGDPATAAGDIYALGCTLHRILRGLPPFFETKADAKKEAHRTGKPGSLEKYELPTELTSLLDQLLSKDPGDRPKSLDGVANELAEFSDESDEVFTSSAQPRETEADFLLALAREGPVVGKPVVPAAVAPEIAERPEDAEHSSMDRPKRTAKQRINPKLLVGISLAALTGLVALAGWSMTQTKIPARKVVRNDTQTETEKEKSTTALGDSGSSNRSPSNPDIVYQPNSRIAQQLVEDDGRELWETPTVGPVADFRYLPSSVQVLFTMRPASLLREPEGKRVVDSLETSLGSSIEWLQSAAGIELNEIDRLTVAYCATNQPTYSTCYVVRPSQPIPRERLVELWRPTITSRDEATGVYENQQKFGYYLIPDPEDPTQAIGFAMGPADLMRSIAEIEGAKTLSGTLNNLSKLVDDDRHFNGMAVMSALFNDEGQALMSGPLAPVALHLRNTVPESIRGVMFSMHLDDGFYIEATVDHSLETTPSEMSKELRSWIQSLRETVTTTVTTSGSIPYWDKLRSRFGIQLNEFYRNTRFGVEGETVFANCWLPEVAAHNLIAGSELAMTFAGGQSTKPVVTAKPGPKTLQELLATPRDLSVKTNPDLGLLLEGIKSEILDDYGNLAFEFDIKLMGNDLRNEGITQNQRPGDFEISQKPLADILAEIMHKANPNKEATGPTDPLCKLIWVVAEEPSGSGKPIILITTRAAAADKGYQLPKQFVAESP